MKLANRVSVVLLVVYAGCSDPICGCSPPMPDTGAYVRGTVVDAAMAPVPYATVWPVGGMLIDCIHIGWPAPSVGTTADGKGYFELQVLTWDGPGVHCVDFEVASASGAFADTIADIHLDFGLHGTPADTADVTFTVSW